MKGVVAFREEYLRIAFTPFSLREVWSGRVAVLIKLYRELSLDKYLDLKPPEPATPQDLYLVHSEEYVDYVRRKSAEGYGLLDYGDTPSFPGVFEDALLAVGGTILCVNEIVKGNYKVAFNPQGGFHHAKRDRAAGFCVFNDVALAAVLLEKAGHRVAVLDVDGHHGDGTQQILYDKPILKISTHMYYPGFYPGTGYINELGEGEGYGYSVNVPLPPDSGDDVFEYVLEELIEPLLTLYKPSVVVLQCGADSHLGDPLVGLALTTLSYRTLAESLKKLRVPLVVLSGGGYVKEVAARVWLSTLLALLGAAEEVLSPLMDEEEGTKSPESVRRLVERRINDLKAYLREVYGDL